MAWCLRRHIDQIHAISTVTTIGEKILLKIRLISGSVNGIKSMNFSFFESPAAYLPPRSLAY